MRETLLRAIDHALERELDLPEPAHAVGEPRRPEPHLPELVTATEPAEDVRLRHAHVFEAELAVIVPARDRVDIAHYFPARRRRFDDERGVALLRDLGIRVRPRDDDREVRAHRTGDEPFVT